MAILSLLSMGLVEKRRNCIASRSEGDPCFCAGGGRKTKHAPWSGGMSKPRVLIGASSCFLVPLFGRRKCYPIHSACAHAFPVVAFHDRPSCVTVFPARCLAQFIRERASIDVVCYIVYVSCCFCAILLFCARNRLESARFFH